MDVRHMEKQSKKILDVFSDGRITGFDLIYLAFYTVVNAYPDVVLDRLIEYRANERTLETSDIEITPK